MKVSSVDDVGAQASPPQSTKDLYRFNYSYIPPIPFVEALPPGEKPTLKWYTEVIWQILRNVRNRLNWIAGSSAGALSFTDAEERDLVDLEALGLSEPIDLGELELTHATLGAAEVAEAADEMAASDGPLPFGGGLSIALEIGRIAVGAIKMGIRDPLALLETLGRAKQVMDSRRPDSSSGYLELYTLLDLPWFGRATQGALDDDTFAWLRVAGPNPLVIEGVAAVDAGFPVTEAHYSEAMRDVEDSLARAGKEGRLYLADYALLAGMEGGVAPYPKFTAAPKALFALPRGKGARRLKPVAIQCGQDAREFEIFTPADGEGWRKAKFIVQSADGNHHEIVSHLGRTHLLLGPFVMCTHRQLDGSHPVSRLLLPHFEGTLSINDSARTGMLGKGGAVDRSLAATIEATLTVAGAVFATPYFNHGMLPGWLSERRLLSPDLEYPYRDDGLLVWGVIERWVDSYVRLHYATDDAVAADGAVARWAAEVAAHDGGRIAAFGEDGAGRIRSIAYLVKALTMIIFTASAQHAVVNFGQGEQMTLASTSPVAAFGPPPRTRAEGAQGSWLDLVAPFDGALFQLEFLNQLGSVHYTQLGQYAPGWFGGGPVRGALETFQGELAAIGAEIVARNEARLGPFLPLIPARIPQSINI